MSKRIGFLMSRLTKGSGLRAVGVFALSLVTTLGVVYSNYYNYWEGTIYRTQTVDFNILSNLLSTKLSILLPKALSSKEAASDLQQAIDSNYGLFGVIVTDCKVVDTFCPKQKILFASQSTVEDLGEGKQRIAPKNDYAKIWTQKLAASESLDQVLASSPHILLYNPPPLKQEWGFQSPREDKEVRLQKNQGDVIGRVYLLRADRPSFKGELERWVRDIPNSLAGSAKAHISGRSLVYNSIVISALVTGLLVLFLMEFAYYLTREAQENEADLVKEKLITEQKLRSAQSKVKIAEQEKLEAEEFARIAAERSEQAIREKVQAEERARTINQQALQEKLEAEEFARIAAERSEQAIREKVQAEERARTINQQALERSAKFEEAVRVAQEKCEELIREKEEAEKAATAAASERIQAIREKEEAERVATIAASEREQARRNERDLYNAIEMEIKRATKDLEEKVEALERKNGELEEENRQLSSLNMSLQSKPKNNSGKTSYNEDDSVCFKSSEIDFYDLERKDLILNILSKNINNLCENNRQLHLLQDFLKNNSSSGNRLALKKEIEALFKDYRKMSRSMRFSLERIGFEIISEGNHYKIRFHGDNRYVITFAKTPEDWRAGMNIARDICKILL